MCAAADDEIRAISFGLSPPPLPTPTPTCLRQPAPLFATVNEVEEKQTGRLFHSDCTATIYLFHSNAHHTTTTCIAFLDTLLIMITTSSPPLLPRERYNIDYRERERIKATGRVRIINAIRNIQSCRQRRFKS